jgi:hypothetical protein
MPRQTTANGNGNGGNSKAMIDKRMHDAFEQAGMVKEDGSNDYQKLRERILDIASEEKVLGKRERPSKATLRTVLMEKLFPDLPDAEDTDDAREALIRADVYKQLDAKVWAETKSGADGPVQRLVGLNMGNGYVLCRTKVGKSKLDAIYITDNIECIRLDFTRPDNVSFEKKAALVTANREMLIIRQPHNAKKYIAEYASTTKTAIETGMSQLKLAAESVSHTDDDNAGEDDE